ncbi:hypothetical protein SLW70_00840 [Flavobacterium sp. NG2]|uniref:hypothetical protein n=1 Tax=Flavobacterium sp. NG2 TaxID=3097547 RepID=UPI002A830AD7|nr:hypothetical protein [Flavobacterium sp. NG2]WPR71706.1 hypothetical protein SLW70_00840 [Flavobacterium sp. NG2]
MNIHENSNTQAPYVRGIFKSTLIKYTNITTSSVEITLSAPANNVSSWKTSVRLVSGTNSTEFFPLTTYTVTNFPTTISIPITEIAKAIGININDILPADVIEFKSFSTGINGKELRYSDLNGDLIGQAEQRQAYNFSIAISCASVNSPSGQWKVEMEDVYGDGWDGAYLTAEVNGVSTNYTISPSKGSNATHIITVPTEGTLTWSYTKGNYEEEHIFTITSPNGTVYGPYLGENNIPFCFF